MKVDKSENEIIFQLLLVLFQQSVLQFLEDLAMLAAAVTFELLFLQVLNKRQELFGIHC